MGGTETRVKAGKLRAKFAALKILMIIYLGLYGSMAVIGVIGGILVCIIACCANLCDFVHDAEHIRRNCNADEIGNMLKGYLIFN